MILLLPLVGPEQGSPGMLQVLFSMQGPLLRSVKAATASSCPWSVIAAPTSTDRFARNKEERKRRRGHASQGVWLRERPEGPKASRTRRTGARVVSGARALRRVAIAAAPGWPRVPPGVPMSPREKPTRRLEDEGCRGERFPAREGGGKRRERRPTAKAGPLSPRPLTFLFLNLSIS